MNRLVAEVVWEVGVPRAKIKVKQKSKTCHMIGTEIFISSVGVSSSSGSSGELYLVTSAEGKLQLIGKNGRLEKTVEAHR